MKIIKYSKAEREITKINRIKNYNGLSNIFVQIR